MPTARDSYFNSDRHVGLSAGWRGIPVVSAAVWPGRRVAVPYRRPGRGAHVSLRSAPSVAVRLTGGGGKGGPSRGAAPAIGRRRLPGHQLCALPVLGRCPSPYQSGVSGRPCRTPPLAAGSRDGHLAARSRPAGRARPAPRANDGQSR